VPVDFVILEMEEDNCTHIILTKPSWPLLGRIDVKNNKLSFCCG